jgi:hypothetical protein
MQRIFISSVMNGFEAERDAAAAGIESLDMRAIYAGKTATASPDPSRVALLGDIDKSDGVVLILGARYGWISESGLSPTEEEFNYANQLGRPIFVFVQEGVEFEAEQQAFIDRVGGGWTEGRFRDSFATSAQLTTKVVSALNKHLTQARGGDAVPVAQTRARELAAGDGCSRGGSSVFARVVLVPVGGRTLINALVLDDAKFTDRVTRAVRESDLVSQSAGITARATSSGVVLTAKVDGDFHTTTITFAADGSVVADLDVRGEGSMGGSIVSYPKVQDALAAAGRAAQALWSEVPDGDLVSQVAAVIAVPEAAHSSLSLSGAVSGTMRMRMFGQPMLAPDPPLVLRRPEVGSDRATLQLAVSLKQAYADEDAVIA